MTDKKKSAANKSPSPASGSKDSLQRALIIELEHVAVQSRHIMYEALAGKLKKGGADFSKEDFARLLTNRPLTEAIEQLPKKLGTQKVKGSELLNAVMAELEGAYTSGKMPLREGVLPLLDYAVKNGFSLVAITSLKPEAVAALTAKKELSRRGLDIFAFSGQPMSAAGADVWLQTSKQFDLQPRRCLTFTSSSETCKAALTAGMCCVAMPDEYTSFQDYSGADMVLDDLKSAVPAEVFLSVSS